MSTIKYESKINVEDDSLRVEVTYNNVITNGLETLVFLAKPEQPLYIGVQELPLKAPYVLPKLVKDLQKYKGNQVVDETIAQLIEIIDFHRPNSSLDDLIEEQFPEKYVLGIITGVGDVSSELVLKKLSDQEKKGKKFIGKADGRDLGHCVYLGVRHGKDFLKQAKYYFVSSETDEQLEQMREFQPTTVRIEFYGDKNG